MKFNIKNLGKIKEATVEIGDLTVICGGNGTNKTWLSYIIYHYLYESYYSHKGISDTVDEIYESLLNTGKYSIGLEDLLPVIKNGVINQLSKSEENIHVAFNSNESLFKDTKVTVEFDQLSYIKSNNVFNNEDEAFTTSFVDGVINIHTNDGFDEKIPEKVKNMISVDILLPFVSSSFSSPLIATSERTGIALLQPEIDRSTITVNKALRGVSALGTDESRTLLSSLLDESFSKSNYAIPIRRNLNTIRDYKNSHHNSGSFAKKNPDVIELLNLVNGGVFEIVNGNINFVNEESSTPIEYSSSSAKSQFLLDHYIKNKDLINHIIIIDEPELNLHPDKQKLMARLLIRLVNANIKILITTHSDHLVREINNCIMLDNKFDGKSEFMEKYNYKECDSLEPSKIKTYSIDTNGRIKKHNVGKFGVEQSIFDEVISESSKIQFELVEAIEPDMFD